MPDFSFIKNAFSKKWVISAPRRAKRPDHANGDLVTCPFCPESGEGEEVLYRIPDSDAPWEVRVIPNKYPFAPIHELVIETPEHHSSFDTFSLEHIQRLLQTYRHRFNEHMHKGQVYIFHNHGEKGGESIPHSHSQITIIPEKVYVEIPRLDAGLQGVVLSSHEKKSPTLFQGYASVEAYETDHFYIFCPPTSVYPDEVWVSPKKRGRYFGETMDDELGDFAGIMSGLMKIYHLRYKEDFPYNFYFYPGEDWYFRLIPRLKVMGGFEVGTNVFVNTQNPSETMEFIREHVKSPNVDKILKEHQVEYHRTV